MKTTSNTAALTPVQRIGNFWVKRDDLFEFAGIRGGKVRACLHIAHLKAADGLITASARKSPQAQIVARVAAEMGIPARCHMPQGKATQEMEDMLAHGAELVQHRAGYNNVIIARAKADWRERPTWQYIPFGMEHTEAVRMTRAQVASIAAMRSKPKRIVVPVGSGMTAAGILHGLRDCNLDIPVLGVRVGADPAKRLRDWGPFAYHGMIRIVDVTARIPYHEMVEARVGHILLDPIYEAKCLEYLDPNDLLWCVGIRATEQTNQDKEC